MDKESLITHLHKTDLVSMATAKQIAEQFEYRSVVKNRLLLTEGKICDTYLFLETGYMRTFAHDTEGQEVTTGFYGPGQFIFEVTSFFNRFKSQENIQALTDCEGWQISYLQLNELFHTLPEFREFGRSVLVKGFSNLKTRMLSMITHTAEQRYQQLLDTNADIFQHAPLKNIATYLGITDTSLSRIRKDLAKK